MGAGFFKLDEHKGGCCQLGRGVEGNSSNRAELGAACLALEDSKKQQDRKPVILLSDSACFLSSSQKWTGEEKSPSMHGNPDADIVRDIVQLLRGRTPQRRPPGQYTCPRCSGNCLGRSFMIMDDAVWGVLTCRSLLGPHP